jgi:hypothetical protein
MTKRTAYKSPDDGLSTLHIRCGDDIKDKLAEAGFEGHYLSFADPAWLGPPPQFNAWVAGRAELVASRTGMAKQKVREEMGDSYWKLARAPKEYERIVLWLEHDLYDQSALARIFASFATRKQLPRIELIAIDRYPGISPFYGLGQLTPAQLLKLWPKRERVTVKQIAAGKKVWQALIAETPEPLVEAIKSGTRDLPLMKSALVRHLQELPWTSDGLSLTERCALQAAAKGPLTVAAMFDAVQRRDPQPFMGDLFFWSVVRDLIEAPNPPLAVSSATSRLGWQKRVVRLTPTGKALLAGKLDWQSTPPFDRWVGGVVVVDGAPPWRWNDRKKTAELVKA